MKDNNNHNGVKLPKQRLSIGQKAADSATSFFGSWHFLVMLSVGIGLWIIINSIAVLKGWDLYPFILLNFCVSLLTVFQATIIMMSQERQAQRERRQAKYDYAINRKAEREISEVQKDLEEIKVMLKKKFK